MWVVGVMVGLQLRGRSVAWYLEEESAILGYIQRWE